MGSMGLAIEVRSSGFVVFERGFMVGCFVEGCA